MNNKKGNGVAITAVIFFFAVAVGYLFFSSNGKNILSNGAALAVRSWSDVFQGQLAEIIPEDAVSSTLFLENASDSFRESSSLVFESDPTAPPAKKAAVKKKIAAPKAAFGEIEVKSGDVQTNRADVVSTTGSVPLENIAALSAASTSSCLFPALASSSTQKIILNEVAWMGSLPQTGETAADAGKEEWMEIKNISGSSIDLAGWEIVNASGKIKVVFAAGDQLDSGGFLLLSHASSGQKIYSGSLANGGDKIAVMDPACGTSDFFDASLGWPGGNNATKQTLERNADAGGWHTSVSPGGTPGAENSVSIDRYNVAVTFQGDGAGTIASNPPGLVCSTGSCSAAYASGTALAISANADKNSVFEGWSGFCYGKAPCSFKVAGPVFIVGTFRSTASAGQSVATAASSIPTAAPTSTDSGAVIPDPATPTSTLPSPSLMHLVIAEVQIAGVASTNDFIKIYNPTAGAIDAGGWRIRKKSSTGTDSSIKVFPSAAMVPPGGYFIWANSADGFSETIAANISSTATLSADNSLSLMDASGTVVDAVAWGTGTNQYVEGSLYPTNPVASQVLKRNFAAGTIVDTDNNAVDFSLQ